jgi:cysteine-rich repeat protein
VVTQGADALVADSAPVPAVVMVQGRQIALGAHCALRSGTVRATRGGTKLAAQWPSCGTLRRVKLTATIGDDCRTMVGKVKVKGAKAEAFTAILAVTPTTTTSTTIEPTTTTTTTSSSTTTTSTTSPLCPPTTTTTTLPGLCGNNTVDPGETCDDGATNGTPGDACPANCVIAACTPVLGSSRTFTVTFTPPAGKQVAGLTVFVDYPEGQVTIPGSGNQASVVASISSLPRGAFGSPNDFDWALLEAVASASPFPSNRLFVITFEDCQCATPPEPADFTCTVTDASDQNGNVLDGVTCAVTSP